MKKISLILFVVFGFGLLENVVADINSGLVAHYKFDGSANDSTVNGNNGTENGGVTYVAVKHGQVANFDGNNDDVNVRHNSIFNLTTFSISGWINVEDTSSNQKLFFKDQTNNFNHDFQLYINNSSLIVQLQNGSQQASLIAPSITEGWHHVVFTSNGDSSNNLYMDSILKDTNSISWVLSGNTLDWSFGSFSVEDAYFKGQLDDVSIYNPNFHPYKESSFKKVKIIRKASPQQYFGNSVSNFIYDYLCLKDAVKQDFDIILELGLITSSLF